MVVLHQEGPALVTPDMSSMKEETMSSAMKRTSEWISSQEIPCDVTVQIGDASFSLHKFLLASKCGYIKKLIESNNADLSIIEIPDIPGRAEAFELAANFCYGIDFEMGTENIAMLRCVAEYLEMSEDFADGNLVGRTETYLNDVVFQSLSACVSVLLTSENILHIAEQVNLVSRCIDAIAYLSCKDTQISVALEGSLEGGNPSLVPQQKPIVDWWAEELTMLRIDMFQRVLIAMKARGFKQYALGPILMLYAQKSFRGLESLGKSKKKIEVKMEHEKRVVMETIVSLLPRERNALSVSFLSMLLRSSIYLETTVACRLDLERRMALQLSQAVLDDLLIPSYSFTGDTLFDVDTVKRIMMNYLEYEVEGRQVGYGEEHVSAQPPNDMERVGKLMESYIAEIASDRNLTVAKFTELAEMLPEQSRVTEDGVYRAIDIFLKVHPTLSDMERKKVCSLMDCKKLSREACAHAAQNDRLPDQTVVQVLYYEQLRFQQAMDNNVDSPNKAAAIIPTKTLNVFPTATHYSSDQYMKLKKENDDLKFEVFKLKMRLKEVEKPGLTITSSATSAASNSNTNSNSNAPSAAEKPPLPPRKSFISNMSKKLGRLLLVGDVLAPSKGRTKASRNRRHSIS